MRSLRILLPALLCLASLSASANGFLAARGAILLDVQAFIAQCRASGDLYATDVDLYFQEILTPIAGSSMEKSGRLFRDDSRVICVDTISIAQDNSYLMSYQDRQGRSSQAILSINEDGLVSTLEKHGSASQYILSVRMRADQLAQVETLMSKIQARFDPDSELLKFDISPTIPTQGIASQDPVLLHRIKHALSQESAVRLTSISGTFHLANQVPRTGQLIRLDQSQDFIDLNPYRQLAFEATQEGNAIQAAPVRAFPCERLLLNE